MINIQKKKKKKKKKRERKEFLFSTISFSLIWLISYEFLTGKGDVICRKIVGVLYRCYILTKVHGLATRLDTAKFSRYLFEHMRKNHENIPI